MTENAKPDETIDDGPEITLDAAGRPQGGDPIKAMHEERGKRKEMAVKLKAAEEKLAKQQPLVDEYQTLLPHLPTLLANAQRPAEKPPLVPGQLTPEQQELAEIAKDLGFEDKDGNPDLLRAHRVMQRISTRTEKTVQERVRPIQDSNAQTAVQQIRERAYKAVDDNGQPYATREAIDQVFNSLPAEQLMDPKAATMALVMARGLGGPGSSPNEPLHIEGPGRGGNQPITLTPMDKAIAKMRGKSEKDWNTLTKENPAETGWELEQA